MTDDESLRADARANRGRILEVARDALAEDPAASLNSIARRLPPTAAGETRVKRLLALAFRSLSVNSYQA